MSPFALTAKSYLDSTEPAVRHCFLALQTYNHLTPRQSLEKYKIDDGGFHLTTNDAVDFLKAESNSAVLDFAKSVVCGTIIQVAYTGISQHSKNTIAPVDCKDFQITHASLRAMFCVGRTIHSIPAGLIVYAARIQYNHWEDGYPSNPQRRGPSIS